MTMTPFTTTMSQMDWQMWIADIEETLTYSLNAIPVYDEAISDAMTRLTNHQAFFCEHNSDLTALEQEQQWMVVINATAQSISEN